MAAHVLAVMNQKGGVGKTTTTASIGSLLASEHDRRVLLIDLDPQGHLSDHFGVDPNAVEASVYNVLLEDADARALLRSVHGLDLLPANIDLSGAEIELAGMASRELRLRSAILPLLDDYDFVLMDCPPDLGLLTVSGLALAHGVVVPMQAEYLALRGLSQLVQTVEVVKTRLNPGLAVAAVVFCMYSPQTNLARDVRAEVERYFPGKVCRTAIRKNVRLAEAPSHGLPINLYDPTCSGAVDYRAATLELLERFLAPGSMGSSEAVDDMAVPVAVSIEPSTPEGAKVLPGGQPSPESLMAHGSDRRLGRGADDWRRRPIWRADSSPELEALPLPDVEKGKKEGDKCLKLRL